MVAYQGQQLVFTCVILEVKVWQKCWLLWIIFIDVVVVAADCIEEQKALSARWFDDSAVPFCARRGKIRHHGLCKRLVPGHQPNEDRQIWFCSRNLKFVWSCFQQKLRSQYLKLYLGQECPNVANAEPNSTAYIYNSKSNTNSCHFTIACHGMHR